MRQVSNEDKSCRKVLVQESLEQAANDEVSDKTKNDAYCKARKRLPEDQVKSLFQISGKRLDEESPESWLWHGRRVVIADGTTANMPDTTENQQLYPQSKSQKKEVGFPTVRMLAFITLGSGALIETAMGACEGKGSGEQSLMIQMIPNLNADDIVLGDAIFETYFILALLLIAGVDGVFEKNGARKIDFRKSFMKLGKKDALFRLERPPKPPWMSREFYDQWTPDHLIIRAIKTKNRIIVTTLIDAEAYPRSDIREAAEHNIPLLAFGGWRLAIGGWLYEQLIAKSQQPGKLLNAAPLSALYTKRWNIELDFRSIKTIMNMEMLRCKTPAMVRKEIYVHFLVYNLIRALMARVAKATEQVPRDVSFKAAKQTLNGARVLLLFCPNCTLNQVQAQMIVIIGEHKVGDRPGRSEPRAVKRRPKAFKKLQHSRAKARQLNKYKG
ncbi:transposase [Endozoicomonas euniceicola]|uniref:Transposase n=2 Tax=Endozoicomonas euniceicola TaxID=1234143 RepID=A0ABY6H153_9GAMM|nr:transposase [Endozoicomonas euniceicola]